mgnify:CR=1 FL=1
METNKEKIDTNELKYDILDALHDFVYLIGGDDQPAIKSLIVQLRKCKLILEA